MCELIHWQRWPKSKFNYIAEFNLNIEKLAAQLGAHIELCVEGLGTNLYLFFEENGWYWCLHRIVEYQIEDRCFLLIPYRDIEPRIAQDADMSLQRFMNAFGINERDLIASCRDENWQTFDDH
ncbi:MAG: hypothetical protein MI750_15670 [Xanthomonadales bacterium]|nr:hypothetical protein [Xanthomonadales bacterium]